jgi:hypothetical protein
MNFLDQKSHSFQFECRKAYKLTKLNTSFFQTLSSHSPPLTEISTLVIFAPPFFVFLQQIFCWLRVSRGQNKNPQASVIILRVLFADPKGSEVACPSAISFPLIIFDFRSRSLLSPLQIYIFWEEDAECKFLESGILVFANLALALRTLNTCMFFVIFFCVRKFFLD